MNLLFPKPNPDLQIIHWRRYFPASADAHEKCEGLGMIEIRDVIEQAHTDYLRIGHEKGDTHPDTEVIKAVLAASMAVFHQYKHHN